MTSTLFSHSRSMRRPKTCTAMRILFVVLVAVFSTGCDSGFQHMGPTEYGVRFRALPRFLGGGVGGPGSVASPLETIVVMPWETILRFDTSPQYLSWGRGMEDVDGSGTAAVVVQSEDVHTRARDGNVAALKVAVRYRIKPSADSLVKLAQKVSVTEDGVRQLVIGIVRADIRTAMNYLRTPDFRDDKKRNEAVETAKELARKRLDAWGVELEDINLKQYRFVRLMPDGKEDTSYQDRLREIQEREQDIEGELSRIETMRAKKRTELLEAESIYNQRLAESKGYRDQAMLQADAHFTTKENEAKAILAEGRAEVEGMKKQLAALSGPGGQQLLKLEVARQLAKAAPRFVTMNEQGGQGNGIDVQRTDMNALIQQLGLIEAVKEGEPKEPIAFDLPKGPVLSPPALDLDQKKAEGVK